MGKYHVCDTGICGNASCCSDIFTVPQATLGDYNRLRHITGEPLVSIWRDKGNMLLNPNYGRGEMIDVKNIVFTPSLGLVHDPCPYLSDDLRCGVHEARPIACATFPELLLADNDTLRLAIGNYPCLKGVRMQEGVASASRELRSIAEQEKEIENRLIGDLFGTVSFPNSNAFGRFILNSWTMQVGRDPDCTSEKSQRLYRNLAEIYDRLTKGKGEIIGSIWLAAMMGPFVFSAKEDAVAGRLGALENELDSLYEETTRRYFEALGIL